ncbi:MAG: alpha-ketoglutarate-dependent dioxygenase AlkB [Pseudomonadota bacterium]
MRSNLNFDLFNGLNEQPIHVLDKDGVVNYFEEMISSKLADDYFSCLLKKIAWKNDEVNLFGKKIKTKRKVAWYANKPFKYTYSNNTKQALPWIEELLELKTIVECKTGDSFNSCLLNLYHDGSEGVSWHSDAEKELKKNATIASLSLGAERKFSFRHKKTNETISMLLHHGSLLVMKDVTQSNWLHRLPPTRTINQPRINLTFRTIGH